MNEKAARGRARASGQRSRLLVVRALALRSDPYAAGVDPHARGDRSRSDGDACPSAGRRFPHCSP